MAHYISAYQVSNRLTGKPAADAFGRVYVRAGDAWVEDLEDVLADDGSGRKEDKDSVVLGQTLTQDTYGEIHGGGRGESGITGMVPSYQPAVHTTPPGYVPRLWESRWPGSSDKEPWVFCTWEDCLTCCFSRNGVSDHAAHAPSGRKGGVWRGAAPHDVESHIIHVLRR